MVGETASEPTIFIEAIKYIFGFILGILAIPLKNWIYSKDKYECDYRTPTILKVETHPIIVKKVMGKTKTINCVWFRNKRTKKKEYNRKMYYYCPFGETFDPNIKEGGKCPFV